MVRIARLLVRLGITLGIALATTLAGLAAASAGPREERDRSNLGASQTAKAQNGKAQNGKAQTGAPAVAPPTDFARSLAAAARRQTSYFVFYNSSYQKIPYPMGDVPSYFGVCTDVVVRAYRALGIDLQVQVQKAGVGTGDTNIDHRRVDNLTFAGLLRFQNSTHDAKRQEHAATAEIADQIQRRYWTAILSSEGVQGAS